VLFLKVGIQTGSEHTAPTSGCNLARLSFSGERDQFDV
jgi:hypothetical protein